MRHMLTRVMCDQRGMTIVEYAMGTAAVVGLGGVLIKFFSSDTFCLQADQHVPALDGPPR